MEPTKILQVGIIGGGDVAQVVHIPTLLPQDIFEDGGVDVVFVLTSDEYHAEYAIASLNAGKHVLVEKPLSLTLPTAQTIIEAEKHAPNGARVFVGYMRRYAPSLEAFKREVSTIKSIKYARVRDIIGPNSYFISQSGTDPQKIIDDIPVEAGMDRQRRLISLLEEAWGTPYEQLSTQQLDYFMMDYRGQSEPYDRYTCLFETGIDSVPRFDSELSVYGEEKSVSIRYQTPFIKGLGITVEIDELNEFGEKCHRSLQKSYEDAYTAELKEFHTCVVTGKDIKTSASDAIEDLKLFKMIMEKYPAYNKSQAGASSTSSFRPSGP
ncbi:hypothetical protein E8E14_001838 [Neopestalotiopsis sp. 37M]|nr:hypothetical protein E8E14_001838 [Neopestalotiopsis sp. 37M]